jgi:peptide/nickel transport system substrate-binding protein
VIIMRYGLSPAREVREIERGRADWTADGVPPRILPQVMTRFPAQAHILSWTETDFLQFNTKRAPFDDPRVRRALDLAIDRAAIVRMYGGRTAATPTCQLLPPGVLGYRRYCPYTRQPMADGRWQAPDLAQARRLVAASGTRGERVTVWGQKDGGVLGTDVVPYIANVLRQLGYRARAHLVLSSSLYHAPPSLFRKVQLVSTGWLDDTPYGFFGDWLLCSAPGDHHWFCDRRLDHEIRRAHALEASDTQAAGALWRKVDRQVTDVAAALPLVNPHSVDFVSARVRDYQANPILGLIADQVWLR